MNRQLHRNLFDTFLYNPLTPFFKGELDQLPHYLNLTVTLDRDAVVAQLSKLAFWESGVVNQDRILGYR